MTATATLADAAVDARAGRDLVRLTFTDRIPDTAFATRSGVVTVTGIDLCKAGTFNGFQIIPEDLEAMVARFAQLRDTGTFVPPIRLDHSWSVLSVVGYFTNLETYVRPDLTGMDNTFLRGDVDLTGSLDYDAAALVAAIKRGALRNRSAELGGYVTNAGVELPLVFYGCAFVDIPAVEGLAPVGLSRSTRFSAPRSITTLTASPEGTPMTDTAPETPETTTATGDPAPADAGQAGTTVDAGQVSQDPDPARTDNPDTPTTSGTETQDPPADPPADGQAGGDSPATSSAAAGDAPGDVSQDPAAELTAARAEIRRLRQAETDREVARFRSSGAIVAATEDAAVRLLSHDSEDVRRAAGTLLGHMTTPIRLGSAPGRVELAAANGGELIRVGMSKDEVGALWLELDKTGRQARQAEYDAWAKHRRDNGIRD